MKGLGAIQFGLLGSLLVEPAGVGIEIRSARQRSILGILLINLNHVVLTERLIDDVWEGEPPSSARAALQVHVSNLRAAVGKGLIATAPNGYRLESPAETYDVAVFEDLLNQARSQASQPEYAADLLMRANGLWRGDPLLDFAFESWAVPEIRRLQELRFEALASMYEAKMACGERGLAPEIEVLLAEDPYRERLQGLYARALYRDGRQTAALRSLQAARRKLGDELGLDLSPDLRALEQRLIEQSGELEILPPGAHLPAVNTSFVGRETEMTELSDMLAGHRLVTIWGPGGVGKSRLALETSWRSAMAGTDVRWAELSSVARPELLDRHVLQAMGLSEASGLTAADTLIQGIGQREVLAVFDGAEHLLAAVADLTAKLLLRCPNLRLLVTSRERLRIQGEGVLSLTPLPFEGDNEDGIQMLSQRIDPLGSRVSADELDQKKLRQLCAEVDGLPLALEIVAARVGELGLAGVLREVTRHAPGARLPERLEATIAFSYDLLGSGPKTMFEIASAFLGSFDLDAARRVGADGGIEEGSVLDSLSLLVDKSLLVAENTAVGRRYRMLDTVRAFASRRLVGDREIRTVESHAGHYLELAIELGDSLRGGPDQMEARRVLDADLPNLRQAGMWAHTENRALLCAAAWQLLPYWLLTTRSQSGYEFTRLGGAGRGEVEPSLAVRALVAKAWMAEVARNQDVADQIAHEALALAQQECPELEYLGLYAIARANFNGRAPSIAVEVGKKAAALAEAAADDWIAGWAWMTAGTASYEIGDTESSLPGLERALFHLSKVEDAMGEAWTIWCLGMAVRRLGRIDEFEERMQDALAVFERVGDRFGTTTAFWGMAEAALIRNDLTRAKALYHKSLDHELEVVPADNEAAVFGRLAMIAMIEGDPAEAWSLMTQAARILPEESVWAAAEICLPVAMWIVDQKEITSLGPIVYAALDRFEESDLDWDPDLWQRWESVLADLDAAFEPDELEHVRAVARKFADDGVVPALKNALV